MTLVIVVAFCGGL